MELEEGAFQGSFPYDPFFHIRYLPGEETQVRVMSTCMCLARLQSSYLSHLNQDIVVCSLLSCSHGVSYQAEANERNHQCHRINEALGVLRASLIAQLVKNLSAMQETPVQFLGLEDLLEKE